MVRRTKVAPTQTLSVEAVAAVFPEYRVVRADSLVGYANNPRMHTPEQIDLLAKLITEFGWTNPILVDGNSGVLAGHGRLEAARKLGIEMVPTIELSHLSAAQRQAYVIADNESALKASWDMDLLRLELGDLRDLGFDLSMTGFDLGELSDIFATGKGLTDPDDAPPVPAVPVSRLGDVWIMGARVVCPHCHKDQPLKPR